MKRLTPQCFDSFRIVCLKTAVATGHIETNSGATLIKRGKLLFGRRTLIYQKP